MYHKRPRMEPKSVLQASDCMDTMLSLPCEDRVAFLVKTISENSLHGPLEEDALLYALAGLSSSVIGVNGSNAVTLVSAILSLYDKRGVLSHEICIKCYYWLVVKQDEGLTPLCATVRLLLRKLIMHMFRTKGPSTWHTRTVPVQHIRISFADAPDDVVDQLAQTLPAPSALFDYPFTFLVNIKSNKDVMYVDSLYRRRLGLASRKPDECQTCPVCFVDKHVTAFFALSCGRHEICALCFIQMLSHCETAPGFVRCPLRCTYVAYALPVAIVECLTYQRYVLTRRLSRPVVPVQVKVNNAVLIRVGAHMRSWARVSKTVGPNLFSVVGSPCLFLARSDFVLDVRQDEPEFVETYTERDFEALSVFGLGTLSVVTLQPEPAITFYVKVENRMHRRVLSPVPFGKSSDCSLVTGEAPIKLWDLYSSDPSRFHIYPASPCSACPCTQHGNPTGLQNCVRCKSYVCEMCFGSVFYICAVCTELDKLDPSSS